MSIFYSSSNRRTGKTIFAILLILLAGCSNHDYSDKQIFHYNESAGISTLDPAFAKDQSIIWACSQLYNGLIQLDSNLNVQPCIAKEWSISPDGMTYTFILRKDILFHKSPLFNSPDSSRVVVASDFVYSFNRLLDPQVASPGSWIFSCVKDNGFSAPNDSTFIITLSYPFAPFLSQLGMTYCSVVPHEVVEHYGKDFRSHPIGTGPFHFQYWKEGVKLVLRRNNHYFEEDSTGKRLPFLDAVSISFIVDRQTAFLEFVKGNLDFLNSIDASYKDELLTLTGNLQPQYTSTIDVSSTPYLNTEYLGFLMDDTTSPLHDVRVRKAINMGFDKGKMMKYLRNNIGIAGEGGFVPLGLPGFDTLHHYGYDYNPTLAGALLSEAGYPNGEGLPTLTLCTTASYLDLCKYIQQQLSILGINIKVDVNPPAALRERIAQGKTSWFRGSWIADYPDAENYLSLFYSPNKAPTGPNYTHYNNPHIDSLYLQIRTSVNPEQRISLCQKMDSIIMEDAPVIVLYYDRVMHFTHKKVRGLSTDALNSLDLRHVEIY